MNTPFFQGPTPEFRNSARAECKVSTLYSGTKVGAYILGHPVFEHSTILYQCPGTSAWAPSVNIAWVSFEGMGCVDKGGNIPGTVQLR